METWNVKALFTIYKVNVEDHPELCERFNIRSVPAVVHYNVKYDLKNIDDLKRIICG
jgi:thioredoxin-like negative regulator of GroEL